MLNLKHYILSLSLIIFTCKAAVPFCYLGEPPAIAPTVAKNVFFSNIGPVLAIGDTITAGFAAADNSTSGVNEYRGLSFACGNATDQYSIHNLITASRGSPTPGGSANLLNGIRPIGTYYPSFDGFNGASKGDENYIDNQINFVVNQANSYFGPVSYNSQWKLVSVYMGLFKACQICNGLEAAYQTNSLFWKSYYFSLISNLTSTFNNKAIINFIGLPKISQFYSSGTSTCKTYNQINNICPCLWSQTSTTLDNIINAANQGMKDAISYWKASVDQDTTTVGVVYQPFLTDTVFPSSTLSSVDCFHPNADGQKMMAIGFWNNIKELTSKSTSVSTLSALNCADTFVGIYSSTSTY